jgi:hypothetical protein
MGNMTTEINLEIQVMTEILEKYRASKIFSTIILYTIGIGFKESG